MMSPQPEVAVPAPEFVPPFAITDLLCRLIEKKYGRRVTHCNFAGLARIESLSKTVRDGPPPEFSLHTARRDMRRTPRRTLRQMRSSSSTLSKCRAISHACRAQCQNSSALPSATRLSFQMRRSMAIRKSRSTFSERSCAAISSNSEISCFNGSNNSSPVRPREIPSPSDAAARFIYVSNRLWLSPAATCELLLGADFNLRILPGCNQYGRNTVQIVQREP